MKNYLLIWILLTLLLFAALYVLLCGWAALPVPSVAILLAATLVAAIIIANELKRPTPQEYLRKKALYPKVPKEYLYDTPPTGGMIFGLDYPFDPTWWKITAQKASKLMPDENGDLPASLPNELLQLIRSEC